MCTFTLYRIWIKIASTDKGNLFLKKSRRQFYFRPKVFNLFSSLWGFPILMLPLSENPNRLATYIFGSNNTGYKLSQS